MAQEVANRLNDGNVGGNPQESDVISAKPLAVHLPSSYTTESSQARTTSSTPQTPEHVQVDANTGKSGDVPTTIRDSLLVEFSDVNLVNFRQYFSIPSFVEMRLPLERK
ncbi:hypothetical protein LIER_03244 [Lithospermum erythrorhizon]|uniref:Uncharacterized protein n=1 Tax=Lithospermum erythrorhizon TaxID=34254 RepID=A0AAV3NSF2_LITER